MSLMWSVCKATSATGLPLKRAKTLEKLGRISASEKPKLSKEEEAEEKEALRKLWLVGKGTPQNKILNASRKIPICAPRSKNGILITMQSQ